ncbi:MAG TPA: nickel pincer cofactor biosynthesis protein LarC [bacterium]|nr:nickel pincer cofactor biosynthesis protein LarC [bacterium]
MKFHTGYFEILNGCAGDMLAGSLIDAGLPVEELKKELEKIPLDSYHIEAGKVSKKTSYGHSMEATQFRVLPDGKWDDSTSYMKIVGLIDSSSLNDKEKEGIKKVFDVLAHAEGRVHGESLDHLHFHQVGQVDAIVEVASVVIGLGIMGVKKIYSSSIGVAKPAPATVNMLKGLPVVMQSVNAEIITPTGIAIIKGLCNIMEDVSGFSIERAGYGAGEMELPYPNIVKFFLCSEEPGKDSVMMLQANIDDMSPVMFERLFERLFKSGALDVSVFAGTGKKNRPVFNLQVMVPEHLLMGASEIVFRETTTLGIRVRKETRMVLQRNEEKIMTRWGNVRVKRGYLKGEEVNAAPEYADCVKIAERNNIPLKTVFLEISKML